MGSPNDLPTTRPTADAPPTHLDDPPPADDPDTPIEGAGGPADGSSQPESTPPPP